LEIYFILSQIVEKGKIILKFKGQAVLHNFFIQIMNNYEFYNLSTVLSTEQTSYSSHFALFKVEKWGLIGG